MRIVVTGGAGFLGRFVVEELRQAHEVTVFDKISSEINVRCLIGDIEDLGQVIGAFANVEAVVHLAAIPSPGTYANEIVFRTNTQGTFNVHEAAWRLGIRKVVSTSSEAALGFFFRTQSFLPKYLPVDEDHPLLPQDCYGMSKAIGELVALGYTNRCGMTTIVLRPPWIVSSDDYKFRKPLVSGNGFPTSEFSLFSYVDARDLARAYRVAVETPANGHHVYFVTADDSTAKEPLSELLPKICPDLAEMAKNIQGFAPGISNKKIKEKLRWTPTFSWRGQFWGKIESKLRT